MVPVLSPVHADARLPRTLIRPAPEVFEKTLEHLYVRRATLENLIRSLEVYRQTLELEKVSASRA